MTEKEQAEKITQALKERGLEEYASAVYDPEKDTIQFSIDVPSGKAEEVVTLLKEMGAY